LSSNVTKALVALAATVSLAGAADAAAQPTGVWRNAKNSVHVKVAPCGGGNLCGTVVWASEKARAKAAKAGTGRLVGTQLMREFRQVQPGTWKGRVFVPDVGRTFTGTLTTSGNNRMTARGCAVAGMFCKSQSWVKIG
jgi:uncharacterized protein (DUF2147 family)